VEEEGKKKTSEEDHEHKYEGKAVLRYVKIKEERQMEWLLLLRGHNICASDVEIKKGRKAVKKQTVLG
jgi:hypothetical protein